MDRVGGWPTPGLHSSPKQDKENCVLAPEIHCSVLSLPVSTQNPSQQESRDYKLPFQDFPSSFQFGIVCIYL